LADPQVPLFEHRIRRRVEFHETDAAGLAHFSSFFHYMEEAEHALWREAGLSIAPQDSALGWPRLEAAFAYHRALRFEDEFEIHIRITAVEAQKIRYVCVLRREGKKVATGNLTIVCVSKRPGEPMRAIPIPPDIRARFRAELASSDD
jgi:acyl-CoA thioester hydrolase